MLFVTPPLLAIASLAIFVYTHTHLFRNIFANSDVECILRAKTLQLTWQETLDDQEWKTVRRKSFNVLAKGNKLFWCSSVFLYWPYVVPDCDNSAEMKWNVNQIDTPVLGLAGRHFWTLTSKEWSRYVTVISRDIRMYCGRFVGPSLTVHGWSPCWTTVCFVKSEIQKRQPVRSFTSFQMFHTHAPLPRGI